jgi:hypothetical protein
MTKFLLTEWEVSVYHSRSQSPSYARCDEGLWPNPYSELASEWSDWLVLTPDIVFLPCFCGIRLWIWPEPLVAPRVRRALGTRMSLYNEISDRGLFCTDRARRARFVQKDWDQIFLCTYRASEVNKKFIIWHL